MRFAHALGSVLLSGLALAALPRTAHAAEDEVALDLADRVSLVIRKIPKGSFVQGSASGEPYHEADEAQRRVTIAKPFWLGKTVVTRTQFALFVSETRYMTDAEKAQAGGFGVDSKSGTLVSKRDFNWRNPGFVQHDDDPVVLVTFGDANAFVAWLARKTNRRVRLPTEAEWEYAARGGTTTPWFAASTEAEALQIGWFRQSASGSTHPVATKRSNPFGLFDMAGNVQEWVRDVYAPYAPGDVTDPESTSATETERRVLRGGSWLKDPKRGRSAARSKAAPGNRSAENGFRVAVDDDPMASAAAPAASSASADVDAGAPAFLAPAAAPRSEGGGWSLVIAPFAAAFASVAWVLARRRSREAVPLPRPSTGTLRMQRVSLVTTTPIPASHSTSIVPGRSVPLAPPPSVAPTPPPAASLPPVPAAQVVPSQPPMVAAPMAPTHPTSTARIARASPVAPRVESPVPSRPVPVDILSQGQIPLALPPSDLAVPPPPSSSMTGPPAPPSVTGPPPPPSSNLEPSPSPGPLTGPPSPRLSVPAPPSSSFTGPPSPPSSSRFTGPPSPHASMPSAPLATLLAALSSRPLLPPATSFTGPPPSEPSEPEANVTAPYPAISSSALVDDPDTTAPFPAIKPPEEPDEDEGPPSPPRES